MSVPGFEHIDGLTDRAVRKYDLFVRTLKNDYSDNKFVTSKQIEEGLKLTGPEVRALRRLAWDKVVPVGSGRNGYFYATSVEAWKPVRHHIDSRKNALITDSKLCYDIYMKLVSEAQGTFLDDSQRELL